MNYLEFDGKNRNDQNDFISYLKDQNPLFCFLGNDELCGLSGNQGGFNQRLTRISPSVNSTRIDFDRFPLLLKTIGGTSTKNFIHMGQLFRSGTFQKYDNRGFFSQDKPEQIDLTKISVPVGMFLAKQDFIANGIDNQWVRSQIPNVVKYRTFENEDHLSLNFSKNMTYFFEVMALMDPYRTQSK